MASLTDKAGLLVAANFIKYAVGFTLPVLMVRILSTQDYGTYQQLLLVNSMALGLLTMGLPSSVLYFYNRVDDRAKAALALQTLAMLGVAAVAACVVIVLATPLIASQTGNPSLLQLLPPYALAIGLMLAGEHFTSFMVAQDRYRTAVAFETVETVVRVAALALPVVLGLGMTGLVAAAVLYGLLRLVLRTVWVMRTGRHPVRVGQGTGATFVREQLGFSIPLWLTSIVGVAGGLLDRGIVAGAFSTTDFAIYSVGAFAVPLDVIFQASVADVLRASLPPLVQRGELQEVARLLREAVRKLAIVILPSFVFLFGFAQEFLTLLFTTRYGESVHVFRIYLLGMPLFMFTLSLVPQVFGRTRINMNIVIGITAMHAVLSFSLLKWMGFYGPAVSSVVTSWISTGIYLWIARRLTGASILRLVPLQQVAHTLAAAAAALAAAWAVGQPASHQGANFMLHALVFSAMFFAVGGLTGLFTAQDRQLARRWAGRIGLGRQN